MQKRILPEIKLKLISLSAKCFWYWSSYYSFYGSILGISARKLELKFPKDNKYKVTESILEMLEEENRIDEINNIISSFYKLDNPFDKNDNNKYTEAQSELVEFKKSVGKDVVEEEIKKKEFAKNIQQSKNKSDLEKEKSKKIEELKEKFFRYSRENNKAQERGYWLEEVFFKVLDLEQVENTKPYKTKTEQIDGHFKYNKFDYLVEIKWQKSEIKQKDIDIFDGKLRSKAQSTRGLFLSISSFSDSAIAAAQNKNSPRIIFMDVQDLISLLERRMTFLDIFKTKEDKFVRLGIVYNNNN